MRVIIATASSKLPQANDFNHAEPGEVLGLPAVICGGPKEYRDKCGCGRSFSGILSGVGTTYGVVAELPEGVVRRQIERSKSIESWSERMGQGEMQRMVLAELRTIADELKDTPPGTEVRVENQETSFSLRTLEHV